MNAVEHAARRAAANDITTVCEECGGTLWWRPERRRWIHKSSLVELTGRIHAPKPAPLQRPARTVGAGS